MNGSIAVAVVVVILGAGVVPIADGLDDPQASAEEVSLESTTHHVHIAGFAMDPDPLTIEKGDTVVWHNHDSATHTATADDGSWDTGYISSGGSESITFDSLREDTYHCEVHPTSMTGFELEVVEPNEAPTVSIDSPSDGQRLEGFVDIEGSASDPDGTLTSVEVRIDGGQWQVASGTYDWTFTWDTATVADGEHTIEARSFDGSDYSPIASVDVETENPLPDLAVAALETDSSLGEETITATVANVGDAAATVTNLELRYEASNAQGHIATEQLGALAAGGQIQTEVTWDTRDKVGEFEITAHVNPDDAIFDPNADNDQKGKTVCVPDVDGVTCYVPGTEAPT